MIKHAGTSGFLKFNLHTIIYTIYTITLLVKIVVRERTLLYLHERKQLYNIRMTENAWLNAREYTCKLSYKIV